MKTNLERIKQDMEALSQFNSTPGEGLTRFSFTDEDRGVREYLRDELSKLGLTVYEDAAGSLFGRGDTENDNLPVIMIGSHFDSVKNGGSFDGSAGVVMALEIMRVLYENNTRTRYPVEFAAIIEREGGRFGSGVFGSRAMAGLVNYEQLKCSKDENGISMAQAFGAFGINPAKVKEATRQPEKIRAFIELHIEQGPILEEKGLDIGIVDLIAGINQQRINVKGSRNSLEAAKAAAISIASATGAYTSEEANIVTAAPAVSLASGNTGTDTPEAASFKVDICSKDTAIIEAVRKEVKKQLEEIKSQYGIEYDILDLFHMKPARTDSHINELLKKAACENHFKYTTLSSNSCHDAMVMGTIAPVALVFVPCKDGKSHCPEEWTDYEALQKGIEVVYNTVLALGDIL